MKTCQQTFCKHNLNNSWPAKNCLNCDFLFTDEIDQEQLYNEMIANKPLTQQERDDMEFATAIYEIDLVSSIRVFVVLQYIN